MSDGPDSLDVDVERRNLNIGVLAGLWVSAFFAEATFFFAAMVFEDSIFAFLLFAFAQFTLIAAILGTIGFAWLLPGWDTDVMIWMWVGGAIGGYWLGLYWSWVGPIVWGLVLLTTLSRLPALLRSRRSAQSQ